MTRNLSRLWRALDSLPSASAAQIDWCNALKDQWAPAGALLRRTGMLAKTVACPSPGGGNCPRQVVQLSDGRHRAVCQEQPHLCDAIDVTVDQLAILALDPDKLAASLCKAMHLTPRSTKTVNGPIVCLGEHAVPNARGISIFLAIQGGSQSRESNEIFRPLDDAARPCLLLTPTAMTLGADQRRHLDRSGVTTRSLEEMVVVDSRHELSGSPLADELFRALREQITKETTIRAPAVAWELPPDARWEEMSIRFTDDEVINVRFRETTRRLEPDQLGMKNSKNGKGNLQWALLRQFAQAGGYMEFAGVQKRAAEKQKQLLSSSLQHAFGMRSDPIPRSGGGYQALFKIDASDLRQGKQGQRQRNFAERD